MPVHDTLPDLLRAAIRSVRAQSYGRWELCIADDASAATTRTLLDREAAGEPRIRLCRLPHNAGIAMATNAALQLASGDFVAMLDHDDMLAPHALARIAAGIAVAPTAEMLFSDEDQLAQGRLCRPYFKPGWDPELMLGQNMVNHLAVFRRTRLVALGGLSEGLDGAQDYDLALRFAAACGPTAIRHVPDILYHWRQTPGSFSAAQPARAGAAARAAIARQVAPDALVEPHPVLPQWNRVIHALPSSTSVSIVSAGSAAPPRDAAFKGRVSSGEATGDILLFLAPGLMADNPGWLRELASQARRPEIGVVGARLDGADGRIVQSGLILDPALIATTLRPRADRNDPGYFGHFLLARTVSAISADCLAIGRTLFEELGGFDPACGRYADVDLCLRLRARGVACLWTPFARLRYTTGAPPIRPDTQAARLMRARWGEALAHDPHLNPNLIVRRGNLALARPTHSIPGSSRP